MKFEIKHRFTGSVLFTIETETMRLALEAAVKSGANLRGAKIRGGITVTQAPLQVLGLTWTVIIWDRHMQIGCEFHSHDEWRNFTDAEWIKMGGKDADTFRAAHKAVLMALCDSHAAKVKGKP